MCVCVSVVWDHVGLCLVLCGTSIMDDVVVMDIHQHSNRLANDERDPHGSVSIVSIQEATNKPSQRNLWRLKVRGQKGLVSKCLCIN